MSQVLLIKVQNNNQKLTAIIKQAKEHFDRHEPLLFLVENTFAKDYIDKLLWTHPQDSFLPHTGELLLIDQKLHPDYKHIFNLTADPLTDLKSATIYELDDQSSPRKQDAFKRRYHAYKRLNFSIATL